MGMKFGERKPGVIVTSRDTDEVFNWMSDGWNMMKVSHTQEAKDLMVLANSCIKAAESVPDAIRRLTEAGFHVTRELVTDDENDVQIYRRPGAGNE